MPERINPSFGPCRFTDLGIMDYGRALKVQEDSLAAKLSDPTLPDRIFFVVHPPVFTLGRNGGRENLGVSEAFLTGKKVPVIPTSRGGNITYHGPGQAVLYPVVDLERAKIAVPDFVWGLEEIMRLTCRAFGVSAGRDERNHGLWVRNAKIGSVGLSIKKGVSIHGLALNINPDLAPFSWINPCGLAGLAMTSIAREKGEPEQMLSRPPSDWDTERMAEVRECFARHFSTIFHTTIDPDPDQENREACHAV